VEKVSRALDDVRNSTDVSLFSVKPDHVNELPACPVLASAMAKPSAGISRATDGGEAVLLSVS